MFDDIKAEDISRFHDKCVNQQNLAKKNSAKYKEGTWKYIELNHRYNSLLWDEEDQARRKDVSDSEIAANKRTIDGYNQKRQDAIEKIDEELLKRLEGVKPDKDAWRNSETAGTIIDRLSILSLKIYHMDLQTKRKDVDQSHINACEQKLEILKIQRTDLRKCLDTLLSETASGRAYFKVYRQYKMYNDPKMNPYLYKQKD